MLLDDEGPDDAGLPLHCPTAQTLRKTKLGQLENGEVEAGRFLFDFAGSRFGRRRGRSAIAEPVPS